MMISNDYVLHNIMWLEPKDTTRALERLALDHYTQHREMLENGNVSVEFFCTYTKECYEMYLKPIVVDMINSGRRVTVLTPPTPNYNSKACASILKGTVSVKEDQHNHQFGNCVVLVLTGEMLMPTDKDYAMEIAAVKTYLVKKYELDQQMMEYIKFKEETSNGQ